MEFLKLEDLNVGDIICIQEPNQKFSHECYIFKGVDGNACYFDLYNDDGQNGLEILILDYELIKCKIWDPKQFGEILNEE